MAKRRDCASRRSSISRWQIATFTTDYGHPSFDHPRILADMETALAIYEALIQANVPPPAARRVAESLEKDMTSNLATKQDLQHLDQLMKARFEAVDDRFAELDGRVGLMMQGLESRIVLKLGALMTVLIGAAGALIALLR
jgi:hypothetical protein